MSSDLSSLCAEFTEKLASSDPVPGGGGAAAMGGALAASLCSMAAVLSLDKKSCAANKDEIQAILDGAEALRQELLSLIDADASGFEPLAKAYAIPKDEPNRSEILYEASMAACEAPLNIMKCCAKIIELLEQLRPICSKLLLSDVGCAAGMAGSGMKAAAINIYVNTKAYKGREKSDQLDKTADAMLEEYLKRTQAVSGAVIKELKGE